MSTDNEQQLTETPIEPYRQTLKFNVEINKIDKYEVDFTTKQIIEVKF